MQEEPALWPELFNVFRNDPKKKVREQDLRYTITQSTKDENQQTAERPNITEQCNKIVNEIQCREM